jgi:predicted permease
MPATTSKATLFRLISFLTLFFGFLTAFIGEMTLLSHHPMVAKVILYVAWFAILAGCIACLLARVPPTWPFSVSSAASSSATTTPICYHASITILSIGYLVLTAALLLCAHYPTREDKRRQVMVLLLFSPVAYLAGCVFTGGGALVQLRERVESNRRA